MSVNLTIELTDVSHLLQRLNDWKKIDFHPLLEQVGEVVELQTRTRIDEEKQSPDGKDWQDWSDSYARTRHGGHSLLVAWGTRNKQKDSEGNPLINSIEFNVSGDTLHVGSDLVYAATHQFGDSKRGIPERPFLGLSDENRADLEAAIAVYIQSFFEAS